MWLKNKEWLNGKSFITPDEMFGEFNHITNKLGLVLYSDDFFVVTIFFC